MAARDAAKAAYDLATQELAAVEQAAQNASVLLVRYSNTAMSAESKMDKKQLEVAEANRKVGCGCRCVVVMCLCVRMCVAVQCSCAWLLIACSSCVRLATPVWWLSGPAVARLIAHVLCREQALGIA